MKLRQIVPILFVVAAGSAGSALEIKLPDESARLLESPLPGYLLATATCYTCHSVDYLRAQPPSARTYWKATVTKMQKTFGAPLPDESVEPIVDYLVKTYGTERPAPPATRPATAPAK